MWSVKPKILTIWTFTNKQIIIIIINDLDFEKKKQEQYMDSPKFQKSVQH